MKKSYTAARLLIAGAVSLTAAQTVWSDTVPAGKEAVPAGKDAVPAGTGDQPAGQDAVPAGKDTIPVGKDARPTGENTERFPRDGTAIDARETPTDGASNGTALPDGVFESRWAVAYEKLTDATSSRTTPDAAPEPSAETRAWASAAIQSAGEGRPKNLFTEDWWNENGAPFQARERGHYSTSGEASKWWKQSTWQEISSFLKLEDQPAVFAYFPGDNIVIEDGSVEIEDSTITTQQDYLYSARELADAPLAVTQPISKRWIPLGTFILSPDSEKQEGPQAIQLALGDQGDITGTYVNWPQGRVHPIHGRYDPDSQRVALRVDGNTPVVLDTGLYNLTLSSTPLFSHSPSGTTETWLLARMEAESSGGSEKDDEP
ncbi:hypothetical protein ACFQY0_11960 [Haloferula chungangensis]|uniref:Uncharacterized protein n=1 Tax=Haloferula chungangensis TaxID=1048331 RepID=A0ABW2L9Z1_9BACT